MTAQGFKPGEQVDIKWRTTSVDGWRELRSTKADDQGRIAVEVTIPENPIAVDSGDTVQIFCMGKITYVSPSVNFTWYR
ncbi:hypothetical protein AB6O49_34670 [Streptomyces sp. SBR177]